MIKLNNSILNNIKFLIFSIEKICRKRYNYIKGMQKVFIKSLIRGSDMSMNRKKVVMYILIFLLILIILSVPISVQAEATLSLSDFIKNHPEINSNTVDQIEANFANSGLEDITVQTVATQISSFLETINNESSLDTSKKIEKLDKEFEAYFKESIQEGLEDSEYNLEKDAIYIYVGSMLGKKRLILESVQSIESLEKTQEQLKKDFDTIYHRYNNLSSQDKNRVEIVDKYVEQLKSINNQITDKEVKDSNQKKIDIVKGQAIEADKTVGEVIEQEEKDKNDKIYMQPSIATGGSTKGDGTLQDMMSDGEDFVSAGSEQAIDAESLQGLSGRIYNILLEIGVGLSVIIGLILGIKFMLSGVEEKAEVKKMIWVYVVGCVVIFGSFGIWKLVVSILEQI